MNSVFGLRRTFGISEAEPNVDSKVHPQPKQADFTEITLFYITV